METVLLPPAIWAEARDNDALRRALVEEARAEGVRLKYAAKDARELCPPIVSHRPRSPEEILLAARDAVASRDEWAANPYGRFVAAHRRVDKIIVEVMSASSALVDARGRAGTGVNAEVIEFTDRLRSKIEELQLAADEMRQIGEEACE